jgi:general secretion pathway protein K
MRTQRHGQRGVALVLVIWVVTLLVAIAGSFVYAMRTDALAARNAALIARADALASAAVSRTLYEAFKPPGVAGTWRRDEAPRQWTFDGAVVSVRFSDESAKIDINTANDELLRSLFRQAGLGEDDAARLLDAVLDWRDPDSFRRPNGAEEPEYAQAGLKGRPANYAFQSTEELQLVLGMRPEVFQRIAPMITVHSRQPGVNPHLASRSVLLAIPSVTSEQVDAYIAERDAARAAERVPPVFGPAGSYASYAQVSTLAIKCDVSLPEGITVSREVIAAVTPQYPRRPYTFLAWREVAPDRNSAAASATEVPRGR